MTDVPVYTDRKMLELSDLVERIKECASLLDDPEIEKRQRILLMQQLSHMANYAAVLATRRMKLFNQD